ncbi:molybdate ABC transporter substrate-binding protein [Halodesulfovibrio spirochaetisodalis]|uniref:Molybdenum ABC transporter substrate-binding protein n=1 Tax=Halodesulfovibrio spirochaetisodalis TaxID=1560234 RepID=A0A1B7XMV1_9BACT|nr:molybdate ABC transporter substrate-binding protein [Halodesulfovibrio spirochaetisodalis]OBQ56850.1 molybdenum ABC transporter substrate-binding protein [Halodesulfovibrio spirochaetisodalis]
MKRLITLCLALCTFVPIQARSADLMIAQAANFMPAMQEIIPAFEKETGLTVQATYTSTGKLYGQIINGAPFDVFLAADALRPEKLYTQQLAAKPFTYAKGRVVLWTRNKNLCSKTWQHALSSHSVAHIAIANPETASYGTVTKAMLQKLNLWEKTKSKLAVGQSISQAFQYVATGAADAGFCAYSYMFTPQARQGCVIHVPEAEPVLQKGCILSNAPHPNAAEKFIQFLASPTVAAIKRSYGYQ